MGIVFGFEEEPQRISAKAGIGIKDVVQKIIDDASLPYIPKIEDFEQKSNTENVTIPSETNKIEDIVFSNNPLNEKYDSIK